MSPCRDGFRVSGGIQSTFPPIAPIVDFKSAGVGHILEDLAVAESSL